MKREMHPIAIEGKTLAKNWWGKSWNANLESYADFSNRIARGRSYLRSGSVIDLTISNNCVNALVQGSRVRPYKVSVDIAPLPECRKADIVDKCGNRIENLESLISGEISQDIADIFVSRDGLFPSPEDIRFDCSCPDMAYMCKHVAAVLYGIGVRFDEDPTLFFDLRGMDVSSLVRRSVEDRLKMMLRNVNVRTDRMLDDEGGLSIFGVLDQK